MAKEYDNDMTGVLFKNEEKDDDHPNWADYKGSAELDGTEYWVSGWIKEGKNGKLKGKKFLSLAFQPKESGGCGGSKSSKRDDGGGKKSGDSDIPF